MKIWMVQLVLSIFILVGFIFYFFTPYSHWLDLVGSLLCGLVLLILSIYTFRDG
ncbi:hypothetical protein WD019_00030 [Fictibacillus sp. Mic-4]|uniref:hypothetical protein n=1 Tax=Fictibacillus TaxID=1329200 RepID=UPI00040130A6|nr:hypothetical protein [Fictibacillus gelatini]